MFNVFNTYSKTYTNVIFGLEMLNDQSFISQYFTSTNFFWFKSDDNMMLSIYIIFTTSVTLSILKLIYDINLKFQIAVHLCCLVNEIINLIIIILLTF